jgi:hypothetical protein
MEVDTRLIKRIAGVMTPLFGANTSFAEDGIYLLDARTTIGPIIDNEGKYVHSPSPFSLASLIVLQGATERSIANYISLMFSLSIIYLGPTTSS